LKLLTKDNSYQQKNVNKLDSLERDKLNLMYQIINNNLAASKNITVSVIENEKRLELKTQITQVIADIINHELFLLKQRNAVSRDNAERSR
jgi:hypothetical protein